MEMRVRWGLLLKPIGRWALAGVDLILFVSILWLIFRWPTGTEQPSLCPSAARNTA